MKTKLLIVTSCGLLLFGVNAYFALAQPINDNTIQGDYVPNVVLVGLYKTSNPAEIDRIKQALHAEVEFKFKLIKAEVWRISGLSVPEAIQKYRTNPAIRYIEPDYLYSLDSTTPDDTYFSNQWGLHNDGSSGGTVDADIDALEAWDKITNSSVVVAVIDSGIDYTHSDLDDNIWTNSGETAGNGVDDDGNGYVDDYYGWDFYDSDNDPLDGFGHGTHVAGIIGAEGNNGTGVSGVSWSTQLMAVKACSSSSSSCSSSAAAAGLEYALAMGADISNHSWGGSSYSSTMYDAILAAQTAGHLVVAAAGNGDSDQIGDDNDTTPHYPSGYNLDNIIAVASTDTNDDRSTFSNYGATSVDLGAPGGEIYSTVPGGTYDYKSGTSMAAPFVTGAASLAWSSYPSYAYADIKDLILDSVDPTSALSGLTVTGGRLNLDNMIACQPPTSGKWFVSSDCTLSGAYTAPGNVRVEDGVTLTIDSSGSLDMDLSSYNLTIGDGSRVIIATGGKID